jgi:hypothetical protein
VRVVCSNDGRAAACENNVDVFANIRSRRLRAADVELHVSTLDPTQIAQCLHESYQAGLNILIGVFLAGKDHANTSHALALLRVRYQRLRCDAPEQRDECAPPHHSITASARPSSDGGISHKPTLA